MFLVRNHKRKKENLWGKVSSNFSDMQLVDKSHVVTMVTISLVVLIFALNHVNVFM